MIRQLAVALSVLVLAGCPGRPRAEGPYGDKVASDVPQLEKAIGLKFKRQPVLQVKTRDEVRNYILARMQEPAAKKALAGQEFTYKLLGLIPDTLQLEPFMVRLLGEQIIGYYDPKTKVLYVVQDAQEAYVGLTITHELVHALQDQYINLDSLESISGDDDRAAAAQAVIEGQAEYEQVLLMAGGPQNIAVRLPGGWETMRQSIRDQEETQPIFASAPMFIQESLLFSYINGAEFVQRFAEKRPNVSPLVDIPISTKQVMHDSAFFDKTPIAPVQITLPAIPNTVYQNDLGEFGTRLFFFQHLANIAEAGNAALGWMGDRFAAFHASGGPGIAWVTVWDSPTSAATFVNAMSATIQRRYAVDNPTTAANGVRTYSGAARTVVITQLQISGRTAILYVDVPKGSSTDVMDLSRVTLH